MHECYVSELTILLGILAYMIILVKFKIDLTPISAFVGDKIAS